MRYLFIISTIYFLISIINLSGQTILTYQKHAIKPGDVQKTMIADYISEGNAGKNITWNFSKLNCKQEHYATVSDGFSSPHQSSFSGSNVVVEEYGNYFFFETNPNGTYFNGWVDKNLLIKYDAPAKKMSYPFAFGDAYNGTYTGSTIISTLKGDYSYKADAYGTIIMPGKIRVNNVLRVKSYDHYIETACNSLEVETTKYVWYSKDYRYPLVVVLIRKEKLSGKEPVEKKYIVYNDNFLTSKLLKSAATGVDDENISNIRYKIYPNPYKEFVNIEYNLPDERNVNIEVFDVLGAQISVIVNEKQAPGPYTYTFNPSRFGLKPATYFVKLLFDDKVYLEKIVGTE